MIRVLVADDHPIVRQGLRLILDATEDMTVAAEACDCAETLATLRRQSVDVVVLDLSMPGRGGLDVLREVRADLPKLPVLVLSMHSEGEFAVRALKAGAAGYLNKDSAPGELVRALRHVVSGRKYLGTAVAERLAADLENPADRPRHEALSDREFHVLVALAEGRSVSAIAESLALSVKTVSTYRTRVLEKMSMRSTAELIRYAITHHLVFPAS